MVSANLLKNTLFSFLLIGYACGKVQDTQKLPPATEVSSTGQVTSVAAQRTETYLPLLKGKRIALVANATTVVFKDGGGWTHLVDSLRSLGIDIRKIFAPEHGFRGVADAGEAIEDGKDPKTGLPIVSLYGKNKKPTEAQLQDVGVVVFDIQDVGVRFYTYLSTLHYVMEACAENDVPFVILDRPNPNGHYVDGPVLEPDNQSFVGMHPVPIVHGMTMGEYAEMINGEGWLREGMQCKLTVIPMENFTHDIVYELPIRPSPNLPNATAINLYPSLCLFEGTNVSVGRGTETQFQVVGTPFFYSKRHTYTFVPQPNLGSKYPKHQGKECHGYDLRNTARLKALRLDWLIEFYEEHQKYASGEPFFNGLFVKLAGTEKLQQQIESGLSEEKIRRSWEEGLTAFRKTREKYLIYD